MEIDRLLALEVERQLMRLGTEDQQEAREEKPVSGGWARLNFPTKV